LYLPQNFRDPIPSGPRTVPASGDYAQGDDYGQGEFSGNGHSALSEAAEAPAVSSLSDRGMPEVAQVKLGDPILHYSPSSSYVEDDRGSIEPNDRVVLIVEDDVHFARILLDMARNQGFKGLVAQQGDIALNLAEQYKPDAITLDLKLPRLDGWTVLDRLKKDPQTRHIPVQVISVMDRDQGVALGAISYLEKPVSGETLEGAFAQIKSFIERDVRDLLLVESDDSERVSLVELLTGKDVAVTAVSTAASARAALDSGSFDCVVLDIATSPSDGIALLKEIRKNQQHQDMPVIIYTGTDLTQEEESQLKKYATSTIAKDAKSADRLLDESALFLHRPIAKMPPAKRKIIEQRAGFTAIGRKRIGKNKGSIVTQDSGTANDEYSTMSNASHTPRQDKELLQDLAGRKVLVVDDDYRNIYALASMLETYGIVVAFAENGNAAIEALSNTPDIDIVLMDVMMPGMDGYVAMETIRKMETFRELPIIALTAKAMSGDREKCLAAGATDYIPKPADVDRLLNLIRQWVRPRISS
jgi:CheY-like chemotaxis protein